MLYVSKKSGNGFEVHDTENKNHYRYTHDELKAMYDRGIIIKGCAYIEGAFTVTPVPPVYGRGKEALAKALLTTGSATGIKGLNLKIAGDKITLLSFEEEFIEYVYNNSDNSRYVLTVPDLVNDIELEFCCNFSVIGSPRGEDKHLFLFIDFPDSFRIIKLGTEFPYDIDLYTKDYSFTIKGCSWGILDSMGGRDSTEDDEYTSFLIGSSSTVTIPSKKLGYYSLSFLNCIRLYLPSTEVLGYYALDSSLIEKESLSVVLGKNIRYIDNFVCSYTSIKYLDNSGLMGCVTVVYLPDNCNLEEIDFSSVDYQKDDYVYPYVFVMSDYECNRFKSRLKSGEISVDLGNANAVIGILPYKDNSEYIRIQNIFDPNEKDRIQYLSRYLTVEDIGGIVYMELK